MKDFRSDIAPNLRMSPGIVEDPDRLEAQHVNPFFAYVKRSLEQFAPVTTHHTVLGELQKL